jgi:hypothetical protein
MMTIQYKYNEGDLLRQITQYVNSTYGEHYSQNQYQATEFIIDGGHGVGFTIGNIMKYAQRYGHKGTPAEWRKDLMKVIHYAIIALYVHDKEHSDSANLADLFRDVKIEPAKYPPLSTTLVVGNSSVDDTITLRLEDTIVPDWGNYNMGTSSLLTSDDPYTINITSATSEDNS